MRVFISGASGFLGKHLVEYLLDQGVSITTIVRTTSDVGHLKSPKIRLIVGNIREEDCVEEALKDVDVVIHAAASGGGRWEDFYDENVKSTEYLLKHSKKNNVKRFVYISSVAVFDHSNVKDKTILSEDAPFESEPMNHYSRSKADAERLVYKYYQEHGLPTVVIRPACLYGPGGGPIKLYPSRLGMSGGKNRYVVLGNGSSIVPLSHLASVSDSVWRCIHSDSCVGKSYNVVEDESISRLEYLKIMKREYNPELKIVRMPHFLAQIMALSIRTLMKVLRMTPPTRLHPLYLKLFSISIFYSNEQLKADLKWQPQPNIRKTIKETMNWYKDQIPPKSQHMVESGDVQIKSDRVLNVGIVGCGGFANTHARGIKKFKNARLIAACDVNEEARDSFAQKWNVSKKYSSMQEMLENESIDVVHIVTSAQTHAPLSIGAMNNGCHVFVEKPLCVDAREAHEMIRVAKDNNVHLCVSHNLLYDPSMIRARQLIENGSLGKIVQVESWFGTSYSSNLGSPYLRYEAKEHWAYALPGSLYQNFLSHPLSLVLDVMDRVTDVKAWTKYHKVVPHMNSDELRLILQNDDIMATLCLSFTVTPRLNFLKVYGTKGSIYIDMTYNSLLLYQDVPMVPKAISRNLTSLKMGKALKRSGRRNMRKVLTGKFNLFESNETLFGLFYKCILEGIPLPVSIENAVQSMEVMDRVWSQIEV